MVLVDIAVPRDIEANIQQLNDVYLYTVDDLQEIIEENKKSRQSNSLASSRYLLHSI